MVNVTVQAVDPTDQYLRYWGILVDQVPGQGWDIPGPNVETHRTTNTMTKVLQLPDGKHTIYFVVSNPTGVQSIGTYSGTINIDGISQQFSGVDVAHPFAIDVNVSNNVATKTGSSTQSGGAQGQLSNMTAKAKAFWAAHKNKIIVGVAVAVPTGIGIAVVAKKKGSHM